MEYAVEMGKRDIIYKFINIDSGPQTLIGWGIHR
jgi:hypothetical protein